VNEFLGAEPTEVLNVRPQLPVPDEIDDLGPEDSDGDPSLKPRREGIPPGFRMRHDKHYVEELMATPTMGQGAARAANPRPSMAGGADVTDDRRTPSETPQPSAAALELMASRLESVVAHGAIARVPPSDLVARTVQAELQRVSRFARALAVIARQDEPIRRSLTAGELAAAVRSACARVTRLHGLQVAVTADEPAFAAAVERPLVVQAIAGTVDALVDLAQGQGIDDNGEDGGRITVWLQTAKVRPALIVAVECATAAWRGAPAARFFDTDEQDFTSAPAAGVLLAAAAHAVRLHGGRVEAQLHGGVRVRYVLPQEPPRPTAAS